MPRKCVICKAYDWNNEKSFHSFPKDEGRKKLWLKACGIDLCLPSYRVCDAHFSEKDFLPNGSLNRIALPKDNSMQQEPPVSTNIVFESSHQETLPSDTVIHQQTNSICVTPKKLGCNELPDVSLNKKEHKFKKAGAEIAELVIIAEFCFMIINAFDILNCRTKFSKSYFCLVLDSNVYEKYAEFINKFKEYTLGLKLANGKQVVDSGRKTGFIGLISALSNLLKVTLKHFLRGGFYNNPSYKQFKSADRKLLVHNEISGTQCGNCIAILDTTQMSVVNLGPESIITIHRLTPFLDDVTSRIAGFVIKKNIKKNRNNVLVKPSQEVIEICQKAERIFQTYNNSITIVQNINFLIPIKISPCSFIK
ncbi:THAP-type domain-containing protein [Aphis craccivora]|uniref:THAP-type domain-containing protein n=1 Tax=Aphis craccivora TaxID=307492 RepID=A0A6G0YKR7_APHCR|nr:THAP-type domain-containing protein [Aphis craccivora]